MLSGAMTGIIVKQERKREGILRSGCQPWEGYAKTLAPNTLEE